MQSPSMFVPIGLQIGFMLVSVLISGCGLIFFWRYLKRVDQLGKQFIDCQIRCAKTSAEYAKREDLQAAILRWEDMLVRIHERMDKIALKLGVADEIVRRNG